MGAQKMYPTQNTYGNSRDVRRMYSLYPANFSQSKRSSKFNLTISTVASNNNINSLSMLKCMISRAAPPSSKDVYIGCRITR